MPLPWLCLPRRVGQGLPSSTLRAQKSPILTVFEDQGIPFKGLPKFVTLTLIFAVFVGWWRRPPALSSGLV
jgi:hypothetical protein